MVAQDQEQSKPVPHPRETYDFVGHEEAQNTFLDSYRSGKLAHAWLISGAPGVGKATLAYRIARFLLSGDETREGAGSLGVSPESPQCRLIEAQSHPNLLVLTKPWDEKAKKLKTQLTVDEVRRMSGFFGLSAGMSGWRVCIVDTADDMNASAANAFLKTLEEPPEKSIFLVLSEAPGRLLPTIRSRCRPLRLNPLGIDLVDKILTTHLPELSHHERLGLARLAQGSSGKALALAAQDGISLYRELIGVIDSLPSLDTSRALKLGEKLARAGQDDSHALALDLLCDWLNQAVTQDARDDGGDEIVAGESQMTARLLGLSSLDRWIDAWEEIRALKMRALGLHLDKKQTILEAFFRLRTACEAG